MAFWSWSQTASSNATADTSVNWAEGQSPSSVNDSARAMMAAQAKWRDDIAGAILTTGTSTAYAVTSYSVFDTLAHMANQMIAFTPHATNGATVTLNVDSLGAKPLRPAPSVELQSNSLIAGTPYMATYSNSDAVWYLHGLGGNTYGVPLGAGMDFWLPTAPSSAFVFPTGQAISRTTYATLFALMGTTYGVGDTTTTFNLPDKTGRVSAMKEASATRLTTAGSGIAGATLGAAGGTQNQNIAQNQLPNVTPSFTGSLISGLGAASSTGSTMVASGLSGTTGSLGTTSLLGQFSQINSVVNNFTPAGNISSINGGVSQTGLNMVQPTIVCNYIIRVI